MPSRRGECDAKGGQPSNNQPNQPFLPHTIDGLYKVPVRQVAVGRHHSACVTEVGGLYTWGKGTSGQLGHGDYKNVYAPRKVFVLDGKWRQVACGANHTLSLSDVGDVWSFGDNRHGQLGHGDTRKRRFPVLIDRLRRKDSRQVAAGQSHSLALTNVGDVYAWGQGKDGQLGLGANRLKDEHKPCMLHYPELEMVIQLYAGAHHTVAINEVGAVWSWGYTAYGATGTYPERGERCGRPQVMKTLFMKGVRSMSCGADHSAAVMYNGEVFTFGRNFLGQLGHGHLDDQSLPRRVDGLADQKVARVFCGGQHTMCLTEEGEVFAFGRGESGQLGHTIRPKAQTVPKPVLGLSKKQVVMIACGESHCLALTALGSVYSWGKDLYGALGHGIPLTEEEEASAAILYQAAISAAVAASNFAQPQASARAEHLDRRGSMRGGGNRTAAADRERRKKSVTVIVDDDVDGTSTKNRMSDSPLSASGRRTHWLPPTFSFRKAGQKAIRITEEEGEQEAETKGEGSEHEQTRRSSRSGGEGGDDATQYGSLSMSLKRSMSAPGSRPGARWMLHSGSMGSGSGSHVQDRPSTSPAVGSMMLSRSNSSHMQQQKDRPATSPAASLYVDDPPPPPCLSHHHTTLSTCSPNTTTSRSMFLPPRPLVMPCLSGDPSFVTSLDDELWDGGWPFSGQPYADDAPDQTPHEKHHSKNTNTHSISQATTPSSRRYSSSSSNNIHHTMSPSSYQNTVLESRLSLRLGTTIRVSRAVAQLKSTTTNQKKTASHTGEGGSSSSNLVAAPITMVSLGPKEHSKGPITRLKSIGKRDSFAWW